MNYSRLQQNVMISNLSLEIPLCETIVSLETMKARTQIALEPGVLESISGCDTLGWIHCQTLGD